MPYRLRREALAYRKIGDEFFLLTPADSTLHSVAGVGVRVVELLDAGSSGEELERTLLEEYDVPPDVLRADLAAFLEELAAKGIVEKVTS